MEARRLVTAALTERDVGRADQLFLRARRLSDRYRDCEEGSRSLRQGRYPQAEELFRACRDADPDLLAVQLAWARAAQRLEKPDYPSIRSRLVRILDEKREPSRDKEALRAVVFDLESLMAIDSPPEHSGPWSAPELETALLRKTIRGLSRYDAPRVPLQLVFRPREASLGKSAEDQLREVAKALNGGRLAWARIQIEGHSDGSEAPTEAAREALGMRRAKAVRDLLVRFGVAAQRLKVSTLGSRYPFSSNQSLSGRDANRRIELFNLDEGAPIYRDARDQP